MKQRIMVVDDDRDAADGLTALMSQLGHEARAYYDAASVLSNLNKFQPTVLLSDINMPLMDGFELINEIRKHPSFTSIFAVAISGLARRHHEAALADNKFDVLLRKPADFLHLQNLLTNIPDNTGLNR